MMGMRRWILVAVLFVGVLSLALSSVNAAGMKEMEEMWKTALTHAKAAQAAKDLKSVQEHLQVVANCIGGKGAAYHEGRVEDPCAKMASGMGMSAAARSGGMTKMVPWFDTTADAAMIGVKATTLDKAKVAAWLTQTILEKEGAMMR